MAEVAACYGEHEGSEGEWNERDVDGIGAYTDYSWDEENDGRCSPEIPFVNKPPRRPPAKSFYRSTTAQLGASSKTAPRKDIIHDKSRKACDSDTVARSQVDSGGRSKTSTEALGL